MQQVTKEQVREVINNQGEWYFDCNCTYNNVEFIVWVEQDGDTDYFKEVVSAERIAVELECDVDDIDLEKFMETEYFENHILYDLCKKLNDYIDFDLPYELS